ncbi:MAG: hypothetical protein KDI19_03710 [Pseudomonadales bacterium]|nr:hypothetical protein [Pseudomonadales bacterium]
MPGAKISSGQDIVGNVKAPRTIEVNCSVLRKGIDNYHIDVQIDPDFILHARQVIEDMVKRAVAGKRPSGQQADMEALSDSYEKIVKSSLHRTKTDLDPEQVIILHFALVKFVLAEVKRQLDTLVKQTEETLAQQQYAGSRSLLVTQQRFQWLRQNYSRFQYRVARAVLRHLQREENNQTRQLRGQFLGDRLVELPYILFNPMLAASSPLDAELLVDSYALWPGGGKDFGGANLAVETFLASKLPGPHVLPIKSEERLQSAQSEIYDELGGLFAVQGVMGPSADQKDVVREEFCYFDHPGNVRFLFDPATHEQTAASIDGMRAQWSFKSDVKKLAKLGQEARRQFANEAAMREMVAGYVIRDDWHPSWDDTLDIASACACAAGNDSKKILARIDQSKDGAIGLIKKLEEWEAEVNRRMKDEPDAMGLRVLADLSRFRLHLHYYRFAHRIFNRLGVITDAEEIQLAKAGGHLYQLMKTHDEEAGKSNEPKIVHHAIIKADVRGSTVVTRELTRQDLNAASYFSTRFFGPITDALGAYGAVKVFIEGDAIILGIYEYDNAPDHWYSVTRACGVAREILDIVASKNTHSRQAGLPSLEIGIGISYAEDRPFFLFDEEKPIMISSCIGEADRLSSCSWKLRESFESDTFNVEVLEIADAEGRGEKGQSHLRYNVNGILLSEPGFKKLMTEITLKKYRIRFGDNVESMYVGRFPDVRGKERDLVIREGRVGTWRNETAEPGGENAALFYEVLPNSKQASQVLEVARAQAARAG